MPSRTTASVTRLRERTGSRWSHSSRRWVTLSASSVCRFSSVPRWAASPPSWPSSRGCVTFRSLSLLSSCSCPTAPSSSLRPSISPVSLFLLYSLIDRVVFKWLFGRWWRLMRLFAWKLSVRVLCVGIMYWVLNNVCVTLYVVSQKRWGKNVIC